MRYSSPEDQAHAYEDHAPPVQKKKSKLPWIISLLVVAGLVLCSVGILTSFGTDASNGVEPVSTSTIPTPPVKGKAAPPATKATPPNPKAVTVGEGTWLVGDDIPAGKYRTPGALDGMIIYCSWIIKDGSGEDTYLDGGAVDSEKEPGRVTLKKGTEFQTSGCQDWVKQ